MESPARSKAVLELGKKLVVQLELGDDLLAQWMAHDIAARIHTVENSGPDASVTARDECAKSILALWEHRNNLPQHLRVFRELDPVIRTLAVLDVDDGCDYRYFRNTLREAAIDGVDESTKEWLELAFGLDYTARVLIQHALRAAGTIAAATAKPWVEAALKAESDPVIERLVVRFVGGNSPHTDDAKRELQKRLRDKISKLEGFAEMASAVAADLRNQLDPTLNTETNEQTSAPDSQSGYQGYSGAVSAPD